MQFPTDFANDNQIILASISTSFPLSDIPNNSDPFNHFAMSLILLSSRHISPNIQLILDDQLFSCHVSNEDTCQDILSKLMNIDNYSAFNSDKDNTSPNIILTSSDIQLSSINGTCTIFSLSMLPNIKSLSFQVTIQYNSALYLHSRMSDILSQLSIIISSPLSTNSHAISLISKFANTILPNPQSDLHWNEWPGSIISIFNQNATTNPSATCVVEHPYTFTYHQILTKVNSISHFLDSVTPLNNKEQQFAVSIFAFRGVELLISILSILSTNLIVNIIDPQYPPERQIVYLSVAQPSAIIHIKRSGTIDSTVLEYIRNELKIKNTHMLMDVQVSETDLLSSNINLNKYPTTSLALPIDGDSIATLSFTSGSTGIPKGVLGRHFSLTHFYPWMANKFNLTSSDKFTMLSGIAHDPIQRDIFTPLFLGASLYIPDQDTILNGGLAKWINKYALTVTHLTPAMGQILTNSTSTLIPSLQNAFFVGDVLTKRDVVKLQRIGLNTNVINMYGTTETQRSVSYLLIPSKHRDPNYQLHKHVMDAGVGMVDVQLLILNSNNKLCGIGELGEIYVRSCGLARGYKQKPDETNLKFICNPFNPTNNNDRMYRTGDLARYLPNGHAECIGRQDDQVKIRGFRIELGEIDVHLSNMPEITHNITIIRRDENEEWGLISYVTLANEDPTDSDHVTLYKHIRSYLSSRLPSYSIPTLFVVLPHLPLTPNGKIDKNRLPYPKQQPQLQMTPVQGYTPIQLQIHSILISFNMVLELKDDLFKNGLHSILATKLIHGMQLLGYSIGMSHLYHYPSIQLLGDYLANENEIEADLEYAYDAQVGTHLEILNKLNTLHNVQDKMTQYKSVDLEGSTVLLTGATGYLGCYILNELLQYNCTVYCLIRGQDEAQCLNKLEIQMKHHLLQLNHDKVHIMKGDLGKPHLGLDTSTWDFLTHTIDSVIHNGALVHWVYPYDQLYATNVGSTINCYELSVTNKLKHLYFVSSTSVLANVTHFNENDDLKQCSRGISSGYGQSKYVCEQMLNAQPLPITVIRPGYIVGHGKNGVTNSDDFIFRMIKGCLELKHAPIINNHVNMCTVDYVSKIVVGALLVPTLSKGKVLQTWQNTVFTFTELFSICSHYLDIKPVEYNEWKQMLQNNVTDALMPLLHFVMDDLPTSTKGCVLGDGNCKELMREIHSRFGVLIENTTMQKSIRWMIGYLIHVGYLERDGNTGMGYWKGICEEPYMTLPELDMWEQSKEMTKRSNK